MARFTKAERKRIIEEFAQANNGWFDPGAFLAHVRSVGPDHPAYEWFEWDDVEAAEAHRIEQARAFARGVVIKYEVYTDKADPVRVVDRSVPFATSPVGKRHDGGGYYMTDPHDGEHMQELARQASRDLSWFLRRYAAAIEHIGVDLGPLEDLQGRLPRVEAA